MHKKIQIWIKKYKNKKMFVKTIGFLKNSVIIYKVTHSSIRGMSKFGEENKIWTIILKQKKKVI